MKNEKFSNVFSKLGEVEIPHKIVITIEEYVPSMYGFTCDAEINEVISKLFKERSKPRSKRSLDFIKSIHSNKFSLSRSVLEQHTKWGRFIAKLYKTAFMTYRVSESTPINYGWKLSECDSYLEMNWFAGDNFHQKLNRLMKQI